MKLVVLALSVAALAGGATMFSREYNVAHFARGSVLSAFEGLATNTAPANIPKNSRSMRELFQTCGAVQQSAIYRFQPAETQRTVDATCARLARAALERIPTLGSAHTILMLSSETADQIAESLVLSHLTAPLESWHAKLRLRRGLTLYDTGRPEVDRAIDGDIGFILQSQEGRAWLARLYRTEPDLRATIVSAIDRGPSAAKAGFLREVRRLVEL